MKQKKDRSFLSQKRKASAYAEDVLNSSEPGPSSSDEPRVFHDSEHRPPNPTSIDIDSSDEETEEKTDIGNLRGDRIRFAKTKKICKNPPCGKSEYVRDSTRPN